MNSRTIPSDIDISRDKILQGMDNESTRSLNGWRENYCILNLVPRVPQFKEVLGVIKHWAKCK